VNPTCPTLLKTLFRPNKADLIASKAGAKVILQHLFQRPQQKIKLQRLSSAISS